MRHTQTQILKDFNLRSTLSRSATLDLFLNHSSALSYSNIEKSLSPNFDRVTVYRTIKTFLEKGIIHKILDDTGKLKYALCGDRCTTTLHNHNHVHFKCIQCGDTHCLHQVEIPSVKLPRGYHMKTVDLLIQGACANCS